MNKYTRLRKVVLRFELRFTESQGESYNRYATAESGRGAEIISVHYWADVVFQMLFLNFINLCEIKSSRCDKINTERTSNVSELTPLDYIWFQVSLLHITLSTVRYL
jgi:hypothetical protein